MAIRIYILSFFILGFALISSAASACGSKPERRCCCKKEKSDTKQSKKQSCCKKEQSHSENKDDCGGKCGDESCQCPTLDLSFSLPVLVEMNHSSFYFSTEKQKSYHTETHLSSGFYSIWSPPNISC